MGVGKLGIRNANVGSVVVVVGGLALSRNSQREVVES